MVASHTETPLGVSKWLGARVTPLYQPAFMVGDKGGSCPLHISTVVCVRCCSYQPFRSPQGDSCMAGYLCLMPMAFLPLLYAPKL